MKPQLRELYKKVLVDKLKIKKYYKLAFGGFIINFNHNDLGYFVYLPAFMEERRDS